MKTSVWILGDQLLPEHPALDAAIRDGGGNADVTVVLVESAEAFRRRPYRPHKRVLLLSALRHYARSLREQGLQVDTVRAETFSAGIRRHLASHSPDRLVTMAASSYRGRHYQSTLAERLGLPVEIIPNTQFLIGLFNPFPEVPVNRRTVMESFYRAMRRHFGILMDGDQPAGGQWNLDRANRRALPRGITPPSETTFAPDQITLEVLGEVGLPIEAWAGYATTRPEALRVLARFLNERLPYFGHYEDAMTRRHHSLYHSMLSPYLNLGLLDPLEVVRAAEAEYRAGRAPLNSVEGFVRQVIGWREYMAWQYWRQMPGFESRNAWNATRPLPSFFWTADTDLACLRDALTRALQSGYNHHIERLMLLSNFLMLTGVDPAEANEWFLSVYVDAAEWVMAPNVIGMGLNADDGLTATKPYIASAAYIHRMSDHCEACLFNPKQRIGPDACPFNALYWNFLIEHETRLRANPRFGPAVGGLSRLTADDRSAIAAAAAIFLGELT